MVGTGKVLALHSARCSCHCCLTMSATLIMLASSPTLQRSPVTTHLKGFDFKHPAYVCHHPSLSPLVSAPHINTHILVNNLLNVTITTSTTTTALTHSARAVRPVPVVMMVSDCAAAVVWVLLLLCVIVPVLGGVVMLGAGCCQELLTSCYGAASHRQRATRHIGVVRPQQ